MFTTLLVPLDGSALAEVALPYATTLASRTDAGLTLVRAATGNNQTDAIAAAEDYLIQLAIRLKSDGFSVQTVLPVGGDPAEWIVEEAEIRDADLIVIASHVRIGVDRLVHGSVAERVVHATNVPVMLVKGAANPEVVERFGSAEPVLLVPLDGSTLAEAALQTATSLAIATRARIVLLSVVPEQHAPLLPPSEVQATFTETDYAKMQGDAVQYLQKIAGPLRARGIAVDAMTRIGEAGLEIASMAHQYSAAAVVMATHGRTGLLRSMLGSVADAVVHSGNTPVVLVRPVRVRAAEEPTGRLEALANW